MWQLIAEKFGGLDNRTRLVISSGLVSGFARLMGLVFIVLVTPKLYKYLGTSEFGLWSVMVQLISLAAFADFGLGNGLLVRLTHNQNSAARESYIASAFFLLACISAALLIVTLIFIFSYKSFPSAYLFKYLNLEDETLRIIQIFIIIFCAILPFSIVQKVQFSNLDNTRFHAWEIVEKFIATAGVLVGIYFNWTFSILFFAFYISTLASNFSNFLSYKNGDLWRIALNIQSVTRHHIADIFAIGRTFFLMAIAYNISRGSDALLLAHVAGLETVSNYQLPLRLYDLILVVIMLFSSPLWSGYANAFKSADFRWVRLALIRSLTLTGILCGILGGTLTLLGNSLVSAWVGTEIAIAPSVYYSLFIWTLVNAAVNVLAAYLNARAKIKAQLYMLLLFGVVSIPARILSHHVAGLAGFILANSAALLLCILAPSAALIYRDYSTIKTAKVT